MTDLRRAAGRSVFAKLVLVMLAMALCLVGLVAGFFRFIVDPDLTASVERMLGDYGRRVASQSPGLEEARTLAARLQVQIRYEGPNGAWTTDESLPTIAEALEETGHVHWVRPAWGPSTYVVAAPGGGRYLFSWEFGQRAGAAHDRLLLLLLASMIAVFFAAHLVLSRALRPLRALQQGVARVSAGDLDVVLENRTRDEFGALTEAFNGMAARVKDMVRARDQLLVDVSHELRSPLTRLKVALALLPDSARKAQAEADAAEMEALTTGLLELERLRDGRPLGKSRSDVVSLLHEVAEPYKDGSPGVRVSTAPAAITFDLEAGGIRTLLRNLVENAVKYSLPDSDPIELAATLDADGLTIQVSDDGPGMPQEDLARIFDPFYRVDRSRSRKTGGFGLGLSIAKRIAEAHGGRLEVAPNTPRGTRFTLILPTPAQ